MTEEMKNTEEMSFEAQILADFTQSIKSAQDFVTLLEKINENIRAAHQSLMTLNTGVSKKISEAISDLELGTQSLDGTKIAESIENQIVNKFLKARVEVDFGTDESPKIVVPFTQANKKKIERSIRAHINRMVEGLEIVDKEFLDLQKQREKAAEQAIINIVTGKDTKIETPKVAPMTLRLPASALREVKNKLRERLQEIFTREWWFDFVDEEGKPSSLERPKIPIKGEYLDGILNNIGRTIGQRLSEQGGVEIKEMPKVELDLASVNEVARFFAEDFRKLNEDLKSLDLSKLDKVKVIKEEFLNFFSSIDQLTASIEQKFKESVSPKDKQEDIVKKAGKMAIDFYGTISEALKETLDRLNKEVRNNIYSVVEKGYIGKVAQEIVDYVDDFVTTHVNAVMDIIAPEGGILVDTSNLDEFKEIFNKVQIDPSSLREILHQVEEVVNQELSKAKIYFEDAVEFSGIEIYDAVLEKLYRDVNNAINEAIGSVKIKIEDFNLNRSTIQKLLTKISSGIDVFIGEWEPAEEIQEQLKGDEDKIMQATRRSMVSLLKWQFNQLNKVFAKVAKEHIQREIKAVEDEINKLENTDISKSVIQSARKSLRDISRILSVKIDELFKDSINKLQEFTREHTKEIISKESNFYLELLNEFETSFYDDEINSALDGLKDLDSLLKKKIKEIFDANITPYIEAIDGLKLVLPEISHTSKQVGKTSSLVGSDTVPEGGRVHRARMGVTLPLKGTQLDDMLFELPVSLEEFLMSEPMIRTAILRAERIKHMFRGSKKGMNPELLQMIQRSLNEYITGLEQSWRFIGSKLSDLESGDAIHLPPFASELFKEELLSRGYDEKAISLGVSIPAEDAKDIFNERVGKLKNILDYRLEEFKRMAAFSKEEEKYLEQLDKSYAKYDRTLAMFEGRLPSTEMTELQQELDAYLQKVEQIASADLIDDVDLIKARQGLTALNAELDKTIARMSRIAKYQDRLTKLEDVLGKVESGKYADQLRVESRLDRLSLALPPEDVAKARQEMEEALAKIDVVIDDRTGADPVEHARRLQNELKKVDAELTAIYNKWSIEAQSRSLEQRVGVLRDRIIDLREQNKITKVLEEQVFDDLIKEVVPGIDRSRLQELTNEFNRIKNKYKELVKEQKFQRSLGQEVLQSDVLRVGPGGIIKPEDIEMLLKASSQFKDYIIQSTRANNKTNTWSATLKKASGEVIRLSGYIDKLNGKLYRHSDTLRRATDIALKSFDRGIIYDYGKSEPPLMLNVPEVGPGFKISPGGDTHSFYGSIINTIRYILSGWLLLAPIGLMRSSFLTFKDMERNILRGEVNVMGRDDSSGSFNNIIALRILDRLERMDAGASVVVDLDKEISGVQNFIGDKVYDVISKVAYAYGAPIRDISRAYEIATRRIEDPMEAMFMAKQIAKIRAFSEEIDKVDIDFISKSIEAMLSQWGINAYQSERAINMMIKTAMISQASIDELLEIQQRSGAMFKQALPGYTLEDALATSFALSSLFIQSTAQSGSVGGTFFRNILQRAYLENVRNVLKDLSEEEMFKKIGINFYPYEEDGVTPKDYISILGALMDVRRKADHATAQDIYYRVFTQRQIGGATAISEYVRELEHATERLEQAYMLMEVFEKTKGKSFSTEEVQRIMSEVRQQRDEMTSEEILRRYIEKVKDTSEEEVTRLLTTLSGSFAFTEERLKISWDTMSINLFREFKDTFVDFMMNLNTLIRVLNEHSDTIAKGIGFFAKAGVLMGGIHLWENSSVPFVSRNYYRNLQTEAIAEIIDVNRDMLNNEAYLIKARIRDINERYRKFKESNAIIEEIQAKELLEASRIDMEQSKEKYENLLRTGTPEEARIALADYEAKKTEYESRLQEYEKISKSRIAEEEALIEEMVKTEAHALHLKQRMEQLNVAADALGVGADKLKTQMVDLNVQWKYGATDAAKVEAELKKLHAAAGITDDVLESIRNDIRLLGESYAKGEISTDEFKKRATALEMQYSAARAGLPGAAYIKEPTGKDIINMVAAGSMFREGMKVFSDRSLWQRIKDTLAARSMEAFRGRAPLRRDDAGRFIRDSQGRIVREEVLISLGDAVRRELGVATSQGRSRVVTAGTRVARALETPVKAVGLMTLLDTVFGPLSERFLYYVAPTEDRMMKKAQSLEELINAGVRYQRALEEEGWGLRRWLQATWVGTRLRWRGPEIGVAKEEKERIYQLYRELREMGLTDEEDIKRRMRREFVDDLKFEAQAMLAIKEFEDLAVQEHIDKLKMAPPEDLFSVIRTPEQIREMMAPHEERRQRATEIAQLEADIKKLSIIARGFREDHEDIARIQTEFLEGEKERIKAHLKIVEDNIRMMESYGTQETEGFKELIKDRNKALKELAEVEERIRRTIRESALKRAEEESSLAQRIAQARTSIAVSNLQLAGAAPDSLQVKLVEAAGLKEVNQALLIEIEELRKQLKQEEELTGKYSDKYNELLARLVELQAQSKDNLVKIKDLLYGSGATFNLPAGIQPMTYYEARTRQNTARNITIGAGPIIVNITVGNSDLAARDLDNLMRAVTDGVRKAQANQLSNHVKAYPRYYSLLR